MRSLVARRIAPGRIVSWLLDRSAMRGMAAPGRSPAELVARANRARDQRDWAAAARDYAAALEAGAGDVRIYVQLGHALKELGHYAQAEEAYRRFLKAMPFDADIHLQLGHLFNKQDDPAAALTWYERALQLAPTNPDIASHVEMARRRSARAGIGRKREAAMRLVEAGNWSRARTMLAELVDQDGEEDLIGVLANVTKEAGDFAAAAALYGRYHAYAAGQAPELLPDVELQTGHLRKVMGDYRGALSHYIRARDHHLEQMGDLPENAPYDREISACIGEIYTCFWDGRT